MGSKKTIYAKYLKQRAAMGAKGREWIIKNRDYKKLAAYFLNAVFDNSPLQASLNAEPQARKKLAVTPGQKTTPDSYRDKKQRIKNKE